MLNDLGTKLKYGRMRAGLSQEQAGSLIGKKGQTISIYETGRGCPSLKVFYKLAARYKVSADWLLGLETNNIINVNGLIEEDIALLQLLSEKLKQSNSKNDVLDE